MRMALIMLSTSLSKLKLTIENLTFQMNRTLATFLTNALIAHGEPIIKPKDASDEFQYEGELVVVIGKRGKNLSEDEALDIVFGYSIEMMSSERKWQRR